jgi:hypothetical protein
MKAKIRFGMGEIARCIQLVRGMHSLSDKYIDEKISPQPGLELLAYRIQDPETDSNKSTVQSLQVTIKLLLNYWFALIIYFERTRDAGRNIH